MTLATTVDALLERCRRDSLLASRGPVHTLGASYTAGGTTIDLNETPTHIGTGELLSIDYELFYVQSVDTSTKRITVIPGYLGSTQANHSLNAILEVAPRYPKASLLDHLEQEIRSWTNELWRVTSVNLTPATTERTYNLAGVTGDVYFLLEVRQQPTGTSTNFWNFSWTQDAWPHMDARLLRGMDTGEFATGYALQLNRAPNSIGTLRVSVAQPFVLTTLASSTDLVGTVGIRAEWLDICEYGVKMRALETTAIGRSDWRSNNMIREGEEVSALDSVRVLSGFREARELRFARAGLALRAEYPYRTV